MCWIVPLDSYGFRDMIPMIKLVWLHYVGINLILKLTISNTACLRSLKIQLPLIFLTCCGCTISFWLDHSDTNFLFDVIVLNQTANRPKAELRADDRDIPVGGSVTLTCSVKPSSSGWKYFWYRGEKTSEPLSSQLSAGPIRVSEGGVYWCRGGRGDPVYYTEYSDPVTVYKKGEFDILYTFYLYLFTD